MTRKPKREKTQLENLIKNTWDVTKRGKEIMTTEHGKVLAAVGLVLQRLEQDDRIYGTDSAKIFIGCYLVDDNQQAFVNSTKIV